METGQDHNLYIVEDIENAVRKSPQEGPANFFVDDGVYMGASTEKEMPAHRLFLRRLLTSSHGNAADGSFACALSRRSNSFLWASVGAIFSGEDATLSQRCSANRTRRGMRNR